MSEWLWPLTSALQISFYRAVPVAPTEEQEIIPWPPQAESDGVDSVDSD